MGSSRDRRHREATLTKPRRFLGDDSLPLPLPDDAILLPRRRRDPSRGPDRRQHLRWQPMLQ